MVSVAQLFKTKWHFNEEMSLAIFPEDLCQCEKKVEGYRSQNKLKGSPLGLRVDWQRLETQSKEMVIAFWFLLCSEKQSFITLSK